MRVPNRVKLFAWSFGHDSLPTHEKLARRRILDEATCPFCQSSTEDLAHATVECPEIATTWQLLIPQVPHQNRSQSPLHFLHHYLVQQPEQLERFIIICWSLWQRRRKLIFEGKNIPPVVATNNALSSIACFTEAQQQHHNGSRHPLCWIPPEFENGN